MPQDLSACDIDRSFNMKISRRSFLAGMAAAGAAAVVPKGSAAWAASKEGTYATLIDLTLCDGCPDRETPACVTACRTKNADRFPEPDPKMLKDYWPQPIHEDWSSRREMISRLTPYNWTFVQKVTVEHDGRTQSVAIPRRCMHCDNPPCVKLCPFGTAKQDKNGATWIDPAACFGGAKCRTVCPWNVPQRQAGVGIYTYLDPLPVGGGVMYKCDLCRDSLAEGKDPACMSACPKKAMKIGPRQEIFAAARKRAEEIGGYLYGLDEHGGTSTVYISSVPFELLDEAIVESADDPSRAMRLNDPENMVGKHSNLAKAALIAPVAGIIGAFAATVARKEKGDE
jgi:formate dehydrogenase iron-sulfur subunit